MPHFLHTYQEGNVSVEYNEEFYVV